MNVQGLGRMNENYRNNAKSSTPEQDATLAGSLKVAWVAGLLSTFGDALGTYAASLAIEEAIEEEVLQNKKDEQLEKRLENLERQLETIQNMLESK